MQQSPLPIFFLKQQNINRIDVVNFITHGITRVTGQTNSDGLNNSEQLDDEQVAGEASSQSPLDAYATNLNEEALLGTRYIENFLFYATSTHFSKLKSILVKMLRSSIPEVVTVGAHQVCLASLDIEEAMPIAQSCL